MWKIIPLHVADMYLTRVARILKCGISANPGEAVQLPCIAWLLKETETGRIILVDAGPSEDPDHDAKFHTPITRTPDQQMEPLLASHGVKLEDVKEIILTHLHWDHAFGVLKFPWAKVYVQRAELQYAIAPFTAHNACYELNDKENPPFFCRFYHQFQILDGEMEFAPGVKLVTLPGHSPGSMGVLVDSDKGRCLIAGDLFNNLDNLKNNIPTGVNTSMYDCYESFAKVRAMGSDLIILPGHDEGVFETLK